MRSKELSSAESTGCVVASTKTPGFACTSPFSPRTMSASPSGGLANSSTTFSNIVMMNRRQVRVGPDGERPLVPYLAAQQVDAEQVDASQRGDEEGHDDGDNAHAYRLDEGHLLYTRALL